MKSNDISQARDPDLRSSLKALRRAVEQARQTAILTNTDLIIVQDGQTIRLPASQLREDTALPTATTP